MTKQIGIVAGVVSLLCITVLAFVYLNRLQASETSQTELRNSTDVSMKTPKDNDVIAVFSDNPVPAQVDEDQANQAPEVQSSTDTKELLLVMPEGWKVMSSNTLDKSECDPTKKQTTSVYQKGDEKITVYENASPAGCDDKTIGDVNVSFTYNDEGRIQLDQSSNLIQCSKDQNSTCPKGDGKVTVFLTSNDLHPISQKSYAFRIDDSKVDSDFKTQVSSLLKYISQITFTY